MRALFKKDLFYLCVSACVHIYMCVCIWCVHACVCMQVPTEFRREIGFHEAGVIGVYEPLSMCAGN